MAINVSMYDLEDIQCSAINFSIFSENFPKWTSFVFITWYGLSSASSVILNLGVLLFFLFHKHLRTTGNSFFACLALADLLIGGFVIPWKVTCYGVAPQPIGIRLMVVHVDYLLSVAFLSICGLTYDRYHAIINPLTYTFKMNSRTIKIAYALIWALPMIHLVRFVWILTPGMPASSNDSKFSTFLVACMIVLMLAVVSAYCCIFREAYNQETKVMVIQRATQTGKTRKTRMTKAFRSCLAVTLCFTCCWIPRSVFMGRIFRRMFLKFPRSVFWDMITFGLMVLSSSLNPILYSFYSHDIRTVVLNSKLYSFLTRVKRRISN